MCSFYDMCSFCFGAWAKPVFKAIKTSIYTLNRFFSIVNPYTFKIATSAFVDDQWFVFFDSRSDLLAYEILDT